MSEPHWPCSSSRRTGSCRSTGSSTPYGTTHRPPRHGGQIQICISSLRRRVAGESGHHDDHDNELIVTRSPGYLLRVPDDALDVHRFEQQVAAGRERARASPGEAAGLFRRALALWRGPALSDVRSELVRPGATRLNEHRLVILGECLDSELRCGRHHEAIAELAELVDLHPLREQFRALLMLALYRAGRQSEALNSYRRAREVLNEELGLDPGEELSVCMPRFWPATATSTPPTSSPWTSRPNR